jgi:RHS repeat-associated protein
VSGDAGSGTQSFGYDALDRVTGSSGLAASRSYTYDRNGNRRTKVVGPDTFTYTVDRTDELVSVQKNSLTTQSFNYDPYGNLTADAQTGLAVTAMTYDLADRLTGIDAAGSGNDATFSVDALGRIRSRVVNGTTDTYSYVGTSEVVTRIATGGATLDSIVTSAGDRLAVRSAGTLNWLVPDLHGNVASALSADEATVVHAIRYDAWGETIGTGTAGGSAVGAGVWTYQGRLDVSPAGLGTPLLDLSARFYAPGIGAFTSLDSVIGSVQHPLSMNRFLYAHANPATLVDPTGHYAMETEYGYWS